MRGIAVAAVMVVRAESAVDDAAGVMPFRMGRVMVRAARQGIRRMMLMAFLSCAMCEVGKSWGSFGCVDLNAHAPFGLPVGFFLVLL